MEGHKHEIMYKIICSVELLHFTNYNKGISKIDIIKVKLMTQLVFSIQKLYTLLDKFIGYYTWKGGGQMWSLLMVICWSKHYIKN